MGLGLAFYASQMKEDDKGASAAALGSPDGDSTYSMIERGRGGSGRRRAFRGTRRAASNCNGALACGTYTAPPAGALGPTPKAQRDCAGRFWERAHR